MFLYLLYSSELILSSLDETLIIKSFVLLYKSINKRDLVRIMNSIFCKENLVINLKVKKRKSIQKKDIVDIVQTYLD